MAETRDDKSRANRAPPKKTVPVKIINTNDDSFLDFGNMHSYSAPVEPAELPVLPRSNSAKASRFAQIANAEVVNIKRIHDGLVVGEMSEAMGTDATQCPKFLAMDLARTINRVLISLNLRPSTEDDAPFNGYNPSSNSVKELKSTIKIQQELLTELGKNLDYFSKYNYQLVELNKTLIKERVTAYQTRDDLHMLLVRERQKEKKIDTEAEAATVVPDAVPSRERVFFDEEVMIDKAFEEFRKQCNLRNMVLEKTETAKENPVHAESKETEAWLENATPKDRIQYSAQLLSSQTQNQPCSTLALGFKAQLSQANSKISNPYREVRIGRPKNITAGNYHPTKIQELSKRLSEYISQLTSLDIQRNRELMEATSIDQYLLLIQNRMNEISATFGECLHALAEEQRISRQWRLKYQKMSKEHKYLIQSLQQEQSLHAIKMERSDIISTIHTRNEYKTELRNEYRFPPLPDEVPKQEKKAGQRPNTPKSNAKIFIPSVRLGLSLPPKHNSSTHC